MTTALVKGVEPVTSSSKPIRLPRRTKAQVEQQRRCDEWRERVAAEQNWQTPEIVPVSELPKGERFAVKAHTSEMLHIAALGRDELSKREVVR